MTPRFHNRSVIIIGATGGIGSAVARALHAEGASLLLFSRNIERLEKLAVELPGSLVVAGDAGSLEDLQHAAAEAETRFGKIDILIHSVGSILLRMLHQTSEEQFRQTLDLNLVSPFLAMKAVLPSMLKHGGGSIVLCSSAAGSIGFRNHEAIAAAKGGLNAMVRSAAASYARQNIRINAAAFGLVDTPLAAPITSNENARNASAQMHPLGRIGTVEDVVPALLHLASDDARWTTGQVIAVDGGLSTLK